MEERKPTLEEVPQLLVDLIMKVDMLRESHKSIINDEDYLMTMEDLMEYLPGTPARQTIYGWINDRRIPFEKHGKRLYFKKSVIKRWLAEGRPKNK